MGREFQAERKKLTIDSFLCHSSAFSYMKGIINKNLIIPTEDLRPTSFGPNDIDNIDEAVEVNFGLLSKKAKG
jgi:hypothetical protein